MEGRYLIMVDIPAFEGGLFRRCLSGDAAACQELVEGFWDRHYLWRFKFLPPSGFFWPPKPQPDPSPVLTGTLISDLTDRLWMHEQLLAGLIGAVAADPTPEPLIVKELLARRARLDAAKRIHQKLKKAIEDLDVEIKTLETQA
jgi:hypothetical protein